MTQVKQKLIIININVNEFIEGCFISSEIIDILQIKIEDIIKHEISNDKRMINESEIKIPVINNYNIKSEYK